MATTNARVYCIHSQYMALANNNLYDTNFSHSVYGLNQILFYESYS